MPQPVPHNPLANPIVVLREEFDDWAVLFNPDTAAAVGVNPVGVAVWKLLDGRHDLSQIVAEIQARFAAVPGTAEGEIAAFVEQLAQEGLVGYEQ
jgi:SynChlorMet cassette protein ScmD